MRAREFRALASKRLRKEVIWRMLSWTISVSSRFDQSDWTGVDIGEGLRVRVGVRKGQGTRLGERGFICVYRKVFGQGALSMDVKQQCTV